MSGEGNRGLKRGPMRIGRRCATLHTKGRVLTEETFAKACDGILEFNEKGEVVYKVCFAPGTLVHTDQGLLPIEQVRVGTKVLSQPEQGGEQAYRDVTDTVAHLDQEVVAVQIKVAGAEQLTTLFPTANHPFWVERPLADGQHWLATECLAPGFVLQLADGSQATVHAAGKLRRTQHAGIGFAADDRAGVGILVDISGKQPRLAGDELAKNVGKLELGEPYVTPVYNFTVDGFHTYYVGDMGVWVHNTNCNKRVSTEAEAFDRQMAKQEALNELKQGEPPCFVAGTLVHTKEGLKPIEEIYVGDWILSYPDDQTPPQHKRQDTEYTYRQVTNTFVHEDKDICEIQIFNFASNLEETIKVTLDHPFFVEDQGWVPASQLNFRCPLVSSNFGNLAVGEVVKKDERARVFNIEVAEFHTYYVGMIGAWVHNACGVEVTQLPPLSEIRTEAPISK